MRSIIRVEIELEFKPNSIICDRITVIEGRDVGAQKKLMAVIPQSAFINMRPSITIK